ncbi:hypothetical protein POM88_034487 [Heracleum sosnowskyi]|uniref:Uncharacterized protein n=1 Tax=Heracleum sosnowskyi TaxID=360622 RepID=A0AAD8HLL7_9APIA|nr:hypothetical protein POM88_034487 [Heracleum sosnowskyi]
MSSNRSWMRRRFDGKGGISEEYVREVETIHNRLQRNEAPRQIRNPDLLEAYTHPTSKVGREKQRILTDQELEIVRYYGLINMPEVAKYLEEFEDLAYAKKPRLDPAVFERYAKKHFISWFERRIKSDSDLHKKFKDIVRDLTHFGNNNENVSDCEENIDQNENSDSSGDEIGQSDEDSA